MKIGEISVSFAELLLTYFYFIIFRGYLTEHKNLITTFSFFLLGGNKNRSPMCPLREDN